MKNHDTTATSAQRIIAAAAKEKDLTPEETFVENEYYDADISRPYNDSCYGCDADYGYKCDRCPFISEHKDADIVQPEHYKSNQDADRVEKDAPAATQTKQTNKTNTLKKYLKSDDFKSDLEQITYPFKYLIPGAAAIAAPADIYFLLSWACKHSTGTETFQNIIIANLCAFVALCVFILCLTIGHEIRVYRLQHNGFDTDIKEYFSNLKNKIAQMRMCNNIKTK